MQSITKPKLHPYTIKCVEQAAALRSSLSKMPTQMKSIRGRSLRLARRGVTVPRDSDGAYRVTGRLDGNDHIVARKIATTHALRSMAAE